MSSMKARLRAKIPEWLTALRGGRDGTRQPKAVSSVQLYERIVRDLLDRVPINTRQAPPKVFGALLDMDLAAFAPATMKARIIVVTNFLRWAGYTDLEKFLPAWPRITPVKPTQVPLDSHMVVLLNHDWTLERQVIVRLMATCGMRISEVANAAWKDVDWPARLLWIPKAKSGARYVNIPDKPVATLGILRAYRKEQIERRPNSPWLFPTGHDENRPKPTRSLSMALQAMWAEIGFGPYSPHSLRHWYATKIHHNPDIPLASVSQLLGHRDVKETQTYLQGLPNADLTRALSSTDFD